MVVNVEMRFDLGDYVVCMCCLSEIAMKCASKNMQIIEKRINTYLLDGCDSSCITDKYLEKVDPASSPNKEV